MALCTDFSFFEIVPDLSPVRIIDVGAAPTAKPSFYEALRERGHAEVSGFEPDPAAFQRLMSRAKPGERHFQAFVGDGAPGTYHQTTFGFTGSLYPPNTELCRRFTDLSQFVQPAFSAPVETQRLDDVLPDREIDMLKIDVQGGELNVLRGASRLLPTTLVVEVEVEFIPLYTGQPLFADVDTYMRAAGFQLHMFANLGKYFYTPVQNTKTPLVGLNQIVYADAIYIPAIAGAEQLPRERLFKLVALLHDFYKSWDLCLHLLQSEAGRGNDAVMAAYARKLGLA